MDMGWMRKLALGAGAVVGLVVTGTAAWSIEAIEPEPQHWTQNGAFGSLDLASAQRGLQVYREVCSSCHSLHLVSFRNLGDLGYSEDQVKAIAAEYQIQDGPNDDGEMFDRPGRPSDRFKPPFANEKAARAANGGAYPPDMSLLVKAREHNEDYIYALLTHYGEEAPKEHVVPDGKYYNPYFPGGNIAMPPPLSDGQVTYQDGTNASVAQMAHDVTNFLSWAAEPRQTERHRMGVIVIAFLAIFTVLLYLTYKKVWRDIH